MFGSAFEQYRSHPVGADAPATADSATAPPAADPPPEPVPAPAPAPAPAAPSSMRTGLSMVLVAAGAAAGWAAGGWWGAGAGALWVGAARNGLRARSDWATDPGSAAKTASLGVIGAALGGYMAYRAYQARKGPSALE